MERISTITEPSQRYPSHDSTFCSNGLLDADFWSTLLAQMAAKHPDQPLEALLMSMTDAELDAQVTAYDREMERLQILRTASLALRDARRALNGGRTHEREARGSSPQPRPAQRDTVLKVMSSEPDAAWTSERILADLYVLGWQPRGQTPKNSIDATLSRLAQEGLVERVRRGLYRLPPYAARMEVELRGAPDSGSGEAS
jgi:hypothetical protein